MSYTNKYEEAEAVVEKYKTRDPFELCLMLQPDLDTNVSGLMRKGGLKGFIMFYSSAFYMVINGKLRYEERLVVAAHELGHYFLHRDEMKQGLIAPDTNIYVATGRLEREANFFGADLMISDNNVMEEIRNGNDDIFRLAKTLRVPVDFLAFKIKSLEERGENIRLPIELDSRCLGKKNLSGGY